jgi:hypothetical protein
MDVQLNSLYRNSGISKKRGFETILLRTLEFGGIIRYIMDLPI